jgi:hypothetical protein
MSGPQQRVREALGQDFNFESKYEAGRGGYSYMTFEPLKQGLDIVESLKAVFETWKLVRKIDDQTYTTHIFLVRSKRGILRGALSYNSDSRWSIKTLDVDNWRVLTDLEGFHNANRNMTGTVTYEKL